jgi:hypothetical protein
MGTYLSPSGTSMAISAWIAAFFVSTFVGLYWNYLLPSWLRFPSSQLEYLHNKDSDLGWAIQSMAQNSAWGKWYAARLLVISGRPISESELIHAAAFNIMENIIDGDIEVRGRMPRKMEYEVIPQTNWRSSALAFVQDAKTLNWKLTVFPRGGAEYDRNGDIVRASNPEAMARNAVIRSYDSLIVSGIKFETLWPKNRWSIDKDRYRLLRDARRRNLDGAEIKKLSRDWSPLFLPIWIKL